MSPLQFSRRCSAALASAVICKVPTKTMLPLVGTSLTWILKSDHNVQLINPHKIKDINICIIWSLQSLFLEKKKKAL